MSTKVIVADDHGIMREGLCSMISKLPDTEVVAQAENGRMAMELVRKHRPDLVIMDVTMPDLNGIEATRRIIADGLQTKVIALSMHADKRFVGEMLRAGASAYLLKDGIFEELQKAIVAVLAGQTYLSPRIAGVVIEEYVQREPGTNQSIFGVLSDREREVLQLLSEGRTTKQIATKLHVSVKTVETHRHNMMKKLKIDSVAELTKYAIREGLTSLDE